MRRDFSLRWAELLREALTRPGIIHEAYSRFHSYSFGNRIAALSQCFERKIPPGPIATFQRWRGLGRTVKRGEKALYLCMPVQVKRRDEEDTQASEEKTLTVFLWKPHWFVLSQTEGKEFVPEPIPDWSKETALTSLGIEEIPFDLTDGNVLGYARGRQVAVSSIAPLPMKTLFHETGHVVLGHSAEILPADVDKTPRNLAEVEAEAVALLCCESLGLPGAEFCRGYIQKWTGKGAEIPEAAARRIFAAAGRILEAGAADGSAAGQDIGGKAA
jgi:antirestriction protein ArdC